MEVAFQPDVDQKRGVRCLSPDNDSDKAFEEPLFMGIKSRKIVSNTTIYGVHIHYVRYKNNNNFQKIIISRMPWHPCLNVGADYGRSSATSLSPQETEVCQS